MFTDPFCIPATRLGSCREPLPGIHDNCASRYNHSARSWHMHAQLRRKAHWRSGCNGAQNKRKALAHACPTAQGVRVLAHGCSDVQSCRSPGTRKKHARRTTKSSGACVCKHTEQERLSQPNTIRMKLEVAFRLSCSISNCQTLPAQKV